jgi:hypothetical protein
MKVRKIAALYEHKPCQRNVHLKTTIYIYPPHNEGICRTFVVRKNPPRTIFVLHALRAGLLHFLHLSRLP